MQKNFLIEILFWSNFFSEALQGWSRLKVMWHNQSCIGQIGYGKFQACQLYEIHLSILWFFFFFFSICKKCPDYKVTLYWCEKQWPIFAVEICDFKVSTSYFQQSWKKTKTKQKQKRVILWRDINSCLLTSSSRNFWCTTEGPVGVSN